MSIIFRIFVLRKYRKVKIDEIKELKDSIMKDLKSNSYSNKTKKNLNKFLQYIKDSRDE